MNPRATRVVAALLAAALAGCGADSKPPPAGDASPGPRRASMVTILREGGFVRHVAFEGGEGVAVASDKSLLRICDLSTGAVSRDLARLVPAAGPWAVSADRALVAAGSLDDGAIHVFDAKTGVERFSLAGHPAWVRCAAFSHDGAWLATGASDGAISVWDLATRSERILSNDHRHAVTRIAFSPDGRLLASAGADGAVRVRDAFGGGEIARHAASPKPGRPMAFASDGRLALVRADGRIALVDAAGGATLQTLSGHAGLPAALAFSPDGTFLAAGGADGALDVWHLPDAERFACTGRHREAITALNFSADGRRLVSGSLDGAVGVWDLVLVLRPAPGGAPPAALRELGVNSAGIEREGAPFVCVRESHGGELLGRFGTETTWGVGAALSPGGELLALWNSSGTLRLYRVRPAALLRAWHLEGAEPVAAGFSPDGNLLAAAYRDGTLRLLDPALDTPVLQLDGQPYPPGADCTLAFSPDGRRLACTDPWGRIVVRNAADGSLLTRLPCGGETPRFAFSPDGRTLATAGRQGRVRLVDVETGEAFLAMDLPLGKPTAVALSPAGSWLGAGAADGTLAVVDTATAALAWTARAHNGGVTDLAFSAQRLVSAGTDGLVRRWDPLTGHDTAGLRVPGPRAGFLLDPGGDFIVEREALFQVAEPAPAPPLDPDAPLEPLPIEALVALEQDLDETDPVRVLAAIRRLLDPRSTFGPPSSHFLPQSFESGDHLVAVARLADLTSESAVRRRIAFADIEASGLDAEPLVRALLIREPSLESRSRLVTLLSSLDPRRPVRSRAARRYVRSVRILERQAASRGRSARRELKAIAESAPWARVRADARAALSRLEPK